MDVGISFSDTYLLWDAAHECGLDLERLWSGDYTPAFLAWVVRFYHLKRLVSMHKSEEVERATRRKMRRK